MSRNNGCRLSSPTLASTGAREASFLNMYALYLFGADLERVFGKRRYLALYFEGENPWNIGQLHLMNTL